MDGPWFLPNAMRVLLRALKKQLLTIKTATEDINNLIIFAGHDWENETETILFTGLDAQGHSVWGKRIN